MYRRSILALGGAMLVLVLPASGALAAKVTVRVEGKTSTLLLPTSVQTHTGSITKGGAPTGACSAASAAGALDTSTRHHWSGSFSKSFGDYFVTTILGDTESGTKSFWDIFVNNVAASSGACGIKLHAGDQLLFAAVSATGPTAYPSAIEAPSSGKVGRRFSVTVVYFNASGKRKPLTGATLSVNGMTRKTNSHGVVSLTPSLTGPIVLKATHTGYVRAAPVSVRVTA